MFSLLGMIILYDGKMKVFFIYEIPTWKKADERRAFFLAQNLLWRVLAIDVESFRMDGRLKGLQLEASQELGFVLANTGRSRVLENFSLSVHVVSDGAQPKDEKCGHFSIRGFAAEVRKGKTISWPFPGEERLDWLPPIDVPDFKYWKCENCVKTTLKDNVEETQEVSNPQMSSILPNDLCSHPDVPLVEMLLLRSKEAFKGRTLETKIGTDLGVEAVLNDCSRDKMFGRQLTDAYDTLNRNDVVKKSSIRIDMQGGSQQTPRERNFKEKTVSGSANSNQVNKAGKVKLLYVDIPDKVAVEKKGKKIKDGSIRKPRTKKLSPYGHKLPRMRPCMGKKVSYCEVHQVTNSDSPKDGVLNAASMHKNEESDRQNSEDENPMSHLGGAGKRKRMKVRTLGNILSRCSEKGAGSPSSGSGASLGIDLNLSPTHQMFNPRKGKDMEEEYEEFFPMSSQINVPMTHDTSADGKQHTTAGNDQTVSSRKKKGKMLGSENGDSSFPISGGDLLQGGQTENEYIHIQCAGTTAVSSKPAKGVSSRRAQNSYTETPIARGGRVEIHTEYDILNEKAPLLLSENSSRRLNILKKRSGQRGKGSFKQIRNGTKEQTGLDDSTMEIVELMARNQLERGLGASEVNNCLSEATTNNRNDSTLTNKTEAEILKFLQEKKSQHGRLHSTIEDSDRTEATRQGSAKLTQSTEHVSHTISIPNAINSLSERAHAFNLFSINQEKSFTGAPFPVGNSNTNCGNQTPTSSKNQGSGPSRDPFFVQRSRRFGDYQNSIFAPNYEKPSSGAQPFLGPSNSNRNCDYQIPTFHTNQDRQLTGGQPHVASSSRTSGQGFLFSQNREKPPRRSQLHPSSSSRKFTDFLVGNRYPQACLQTPEAYQSQTLPWQNSCRGDQRAWPPKLPNCLPSRNNNPWEFGIDSNTGSKISQCLELFPNGNEHCNQCVKPTDAARREATSKQLAKHLDNRNKNRNFDFEAGKRTHLEYMFSCRETGMQFNPQSVRQVDLYNKESIPATDLLRLMDTGIRPSTLVNEDKSKLSQQYSLYPDPNQLEMSRSGHLGNNNDALLHPPLAEHLKRNQYTAGTFSGKCPMPEANKVSSSAPPVGEVCANSLLQNGELIKMDAWLRRGFPATMTPDSPNDPMKVTANMRGVESQSKTSRIITSLSEKDTSGTNHELTLTLSPQKGFLPTPESRLPPRHPLALKDTTNCLEFKAKNVATNSSAKISYNDGVCSMNKNPAEFTLPEAENEYMTGYRDVQNKKRVLPTEKTDAVGLVSNKRQTKVRFAALKDV